MKRMPKYTAGMFKKKMPRFGASAIRLPRIKKYAGGGTTEEMENEKNVVKFLNQPDTMQEKKARELAKKAEEKAPGKDADQQDEDEVIVTPEEGKKQLEKDRLEDLKRYMKEQEEKRKERFGLKRPPQTPPKAITAPYKPDSMKPKATFKRGGSVSSASKRADGCAIRGKTKGRFV